MSRISMTASDRMNTQIQTAGFEYSMYIQLRFLVRTTNIWNQVCLGFGLRL